MFNRATASLLILFATACGGGGSSPSSSASPTADPATAPDPSASPNPNPNPSPSPTAPSAPSNPAPKSTPANQHRRCGWIAAGDTAGYTAFAAHADFFDAIHPDWYALGPDAVSLRTLATADDPGMLSAAAAHHVKVIPLVASVEDANLTRAMLNDPAKRAAHVQALVALTVGHHYDGLDLDYEALWDGGDRGPFDAFATAFGQAMRAAGKEASFAIPGLDQPAAGSAYSYADLAAAVDRVHIMGYDFHNVNTHPGPTAPLGWIDAVARNAAASGHPEKFVLGLPNYGLTTGWFTTLAKAPAACTGPIATTTDHMFTCPNGNFDAGRAPNCDSAHGHIFFDDLPSLEERIAKAQARGLGGITYWTVGDELPGFFDLVKKYF